MEPTREKIINNLVGKRFTLYSKLSKSLDNEGHLCYKNNEMTVYDCLFYLNINTCLGGEFSICQRHNEKLFPKGYECRIGYNLSGDEI